MNCTLLRTAESSQDKTHRDLFLEWFPNIKHVSYETGRGRVWRLSTFTCSCTLWHLRQDLNIDSALHDEFNERFLMSQWKIPRKVTAIERKIFCWNLNILLIWSLHEELSYVRASLSLCQLFKLINLLIFRSKKALTCFVERDSKEGK